MTDDQHQTYHQTYYDIHREHLLQRQMAYYKEHRNEYIAKMRVYNREYYLRRKMTCNTCKEPKVPKPKKEPKAPKVVSPLLAKEESAPSTAVIPPLHSVKEWKFVEPKPKKTVPKYQKTEFQVVKGSFVLSFD